MIVFKILLVILIVAPLALLSCAMLKNMWVHVIGKSKENRNHGRGSKVKTGSVCTEENSERNVNGRR